MKRKIVIETISFLFIVLFVYASLNKLTDYEKFVIQLGQSPLLIGIGKEVGSLVIAIELIISTMLVFPVTRLVAFYSAFSLMSMFTTYIVVILNFSSHVPCSCGGILEKMGWKEHLIFNIAFVLFAAIGVALETIDKKPQPQSRIA